jgi:hypothetical protein
MSTFRRDLPLGKGLKVLNDKYIVKTSENYRGLSYGNIIATWQNWLLSENPDEKQYGDILFLRGNIGYHQSNANYLDSFIEIPEGMAILVPIVTTHFTMGDSYKGKIINNEFYLRKAVREHVDAAGPFWATLEKMGKNCKAFKLVPNLESYRVQSTLFELHISKKNPFLNKMDEPNYPGKHTALVSGYFVLLQDLPISSYRIRFGGYGMDGFYTDSLYEIKIISKESTVKDISGNTFTSSHLLMEKKVAIKILDKDSKLN